MKRKDVDQVVDEELVGPFYHASEQPLPVGRTLTTRRSAGWTPSLVNYVRPKGVAPRNDHLFMVRDPGCLRALGVLADEHIYKVTPRAPVQHANYGWMDRLDDLELGLSPKRQAEERARLLAAGWTLTSTPLKGGDAVERWYDSEGYPHGGLSDVLAEEYAKNYWTGAPTEPCMDEYLTTAFRVDEMVGWT